jgi:cephalosporin hydroxylase/SAM-dependent methyltransferase
MSNEQSALKMQPTEPSRETDQCAERQPLPECDYVSPNLSIVRLDYAFPNMIVGDTRRNPWPYLRRNIAHNWYVDRREPGCGFLSRDEAHIVYHTALLFPGCRALEIGCWLGWSAAHMALAGVHLDVIDPLLSNPVVFTSVTDSLMAVGVLNNVNLIVGRSPEKVHELAAQTQGKWSLLFIDGDHEGTAPLKDAVACAPHAEADAIILFHDLASPHVTEGLNYLRSQGWQTMIYETMQIMGVAWRGNVKPVEHRPDPIIREPLPEHLRAYPVSGRTTTPQANGVAHDSSLEIPVNDLLEFVENCPIPTAVNCTGDQARFLRSLREGRQAADSENLSHAIQSLNDALSHAANSYQAHKLLANAYRHIGSWRDSLRHLILAQTSHTRLPAADQQEFFALAAAVRPFTILSNARLLALYVLARQVCLDDVPGDFVECGTCKGGSAALLASVIHRYSVRPRKVYAFDTFEGMPDPTEVDRHDGIPANATSFGAGKLKAAIEENLKVVCQRMNVQDIVVPVQGLFHDTLPAARDQIEAIAFLHVDGDWYELTLDIFTNLYDKVSADGIIQIDDYGYWEGCRKAVHEFEASRRTWFPLSRIDETGVWFRKATDADADGSLTRMLWDLARTARARGNQQLATRSGAALLKVLPTLINAPAAPLSDVLVVPPGIPMPIPKSQPNPFGPLVLTEPQRRLFFHDLIVQTRNFSHVTWLGYPIWQNVLDLWTLQEAITEIKPALLIECGTNRGGSALFFAHLFDLLGRGRVVTSDIMKMHDLSHPRISFLIGSSVSDDVFSQVRAEAAAAAGPVMVILDSDHAAAHVFKEMELYGSLVTPGSYMLVQDGVIDVMDEFRGGRPGPLVAIEEFLKRHTEFALDIERCDRFLITHHPKGWLRRKPF